jgi:uncharacterized protein YoxC
LFAIYCALLRVISLAAFSNLLVAVAQPSGIEIIEELNYLGKLISEFDHKVDGLGEDFKALGITQMKTDQKIDGLGEEVKTLGITQKKTDQKIDGLEEKVDGLGKKVNDIGQKVHELILDLKQFDFDTSVKINDIGKKRFLSAFIPSLLVFLALFIHF